MDLLKDKGMSLNVFTLQSACMTALKSTASENDKLYNLEYAQSQFV